MQDKSRHDIEYIEIALLLDAIAKRYGYDFTNYAEASIKRRIESYMIKNQYRHISDCISTLLYDQEKFIEFIYLLSVHVTEMFRDPCFFKTLHERVLPLLATYPFINIWLAGCSSGEEAYSLAILLYEAGLLPRCKIYATDFCSTILKQAEAGVIDTEAMRQYTKNYQLSGGAKSFSDYYVSQGKKVIMANFLRESIHFMPHNLVDDQCFIQAHLVICRNVLIYFNQTLQASVLRLLADSVICKGFLCLGDKETLRYVNVKKCFDVFAEQQRIYCRNRNVLCD